MIIIIIAGNGRKELIDRLDMKDFDFGLIRWDAFKWLELKYIEGGTRFVIKSFAQINGTMGLIGVYDSGSIGHKTVAAAYYEFGSQGPCTFNEFF